MAGHSCSICGDWFSLSASLFLHKSKTHHSQESDGNSKIHKFLEELLCEETVYLSDESFNYTLVFSSKINRIPKIKIEELIENVITEPEFIKLEVNPWSLSQAIDSPSDINKGDLAEEVSPANDMQNHTLLHRRTDHDLISQTGTIRSINLIEIDDPLMLATFKSRQSDENHTNVVETESPYKTFTSANILNEQNFKHGSIDIMYSSDTELNTASDHDRANSSNYLESNELDLKKWNCPKCLKSVYFTNLKRHFQLVHKYNKPKALEAYNRAKTVRAAKMSENVICLICSELIYMKNMNHHLRVVHNVTDAIEFELLNSGRHPSIVHGSIQCLKCDFIASSQSHALVHNIAIHSSVSKTEVTESAMTLDLQNRANNILTESSEINEDAQMRKNEYLRCLYFSCPICGEAGRSSNIRSHFKTVHQKSRSQTCQIINKNRNMLKVLSVPCPLCLLSFSSVHALSMHNITSHPLSSTNAPSIILIAENDETCSCSICESNFSSRNDTLYHICVQHKIEIQRINLSTNEQFGCNICPYTTSIFPLYVHHEHQVHMLDHINRTNQKVMKTKPKPTPHRKRKKPTSNDFLCNICGHASKTNHDLTMHMVTHSSERPFICDICNRGFKKRETMREHLFVHTGFKRYTCPVQGCDERFAQKAGLQQHKIRKHLPEERFKCEICDKKFVFLNKYKFV